MNKMCKELALHLFGHPTELDYCWWRQQQEEDALEPFGNLAEKFLSDLGNQWDDDDETEESLSASINKMVSGGQGKTDVSQERCLVCYSIIDSQDEKNFRTKSSEHLISKGNEEKAAELTQFLGIIASSSSIVNDDLNNGFQNAEKFERTINNLAVQPRCLCSTCSNACAKLLWRHQALQNIVKLEQQMEQLQQKVIYAIQLSSMLAERNKARVKVPGCGGSARKAETNKKVREGAHMVLVDQVREIVTLRASCFVKREDKSGTGSKLEAASGKTATDFKKLDQSTKIVVQVSPSSLINQSPLVTECIGEDTDKSDSVIKNEIDGYQLFDEKENLSGDNLGWISDEELVESRDDTCDKKIKVIDSSSLGIAPKSLPIDSNNGIKRARRGRPGKLHSEETYLCTQCHLKFNCSKTLSRHVKATHGDGYPCSMCTLKFSSDQALYKHKNEMHPSGVYYNCTQCPSKFRSESSLVHHIRRHEIQCNICGKVIGINTTLARHIKSHHGEGYPCDICGLKLAHLSGLIQHKKSKHLGIKNKLKPKVFQCDQCDKAFQSKYRLAEHIEGKHEGGVQCDICGLKLSSRSTLSEHKRVRHLGIKRYACEYCDQKFSKKCGLTEHTRVHTGERPFPCVECEDAFKSQRELNCHVEKMHQQLMVKVKRRFQCDVCGDTLCSQTVLKQHKRIKHLGIRPHVCSYCGKSFGTNKDMLVHVRGHTNERPYVCHLCGESFIQRVSLRRHLRLKHQEVSLDQISVTSGQGKTPWRTEDVESDSMEDAQ